MPWYFAKLQKRSLDFAVICFKNMKSVIQKEMCSLNLLKRFWNYKGFQVQLETKNSVSDLFSVNT